MIRPRATSWNWWLWSVSPGLLYAASSLLPRNPCAWITPGSRVGDGRNFTTFTFIDPGKAQPVPSLGPSLCLPIEVLKSSRNYAEGLEKFRKKKMQKWRQVEIQLEQTEFSCVLVKKITQNASGWNCSQDFCIIWYFVTFSRVSRKEVGLKKEKRDYKKMNSSRPWPTMIIIWPTFGHLEILIIPRNCPPKR